MNNNNTIEHPLFHAWHLRSESGCVDVTCATIEGFWRALVTRASNDIITTKKEFVVCRADMPVFDEESEPDLKTAVRSPVLPNITGRRYIVQFMFSTVTELLKAVVLLMLLAIGHEQPFSDDIILRVDPVSLLLELLTPSHAIWLRRFVYRQFSVKCKAERGHVVCLTWKEYEACMQVRAELKRAKKRDKKKRNKNKRSSTTTTNESPELPTVVDDDPTAIHAQSFLLSDVIDRIQIMFYAGRRLYGPHLLFPYYSLERVKGRYPTLKMSARQPDVDRGLYVNTRDCTTSLELPTRSNPIISRRHVISLASAESGSGDMATHRMGAILPPTATTPVREWWVSNRGAPVLTHYDMVRGPGITAEHTRFPWLYMTSQNTSLSQSMILMDHLTYLRHKNMPILLSTARRIVEPANGAPINSKYQVVEEVSIEIKHWKLVQIDMRFGKPPVMRNVATGKQIHSPLESSAFVKHKSDLHFVVVVASETYDCEIIIDMAPVVTERGFVTEWDGFYWTTICQDAMSDMVEPHRLPPDTVAALLPGTICPSFMTSYACYIVDQMPQAEYSLYDVKTWKGKWSVADTAKMVKRDEASCVIEVDTTPTDIIYNFCPDEWRSSDLGRSLRLSSQFARMAALRCTKMLISYGEKKLAELAKGNISEEITVKEDIGKWLEAYDKKYNNV